MALRGTALADRVQKLRGWVADRTAASTFNVYDLASAPVSGFMDGIPAETDFLLSPRRMTARNAFETQVFDLQAIHGICDITTLSLGNILQEQGVSTSRYCFAQQRPLRENIFVLVDRLATIRVASPIDNEFGTSFGVDDGTYANPNNGLTPATERFLTWDGTSLNISTSGTPFVMPVGIQQTARATPGKDPNMPIAYGEGRFTIYIPPLPGVVLDATTRIVVGSDRYELLQVLTDTGSGLRGTVAIARRLNDG